MYRLGDGPLVGIEHASERLAWLGYLEGSTPYYDEGVGNAVRAFQQAEGLSADAIAGPATLGRLQERTGGPRITRLLVHHAAGSRLSTAEDVARFHTETRGWSAIAYQWTLRQPHNGLPLLELVAGRAHRGGPWLETPGGHVLGAANLDSVAVCLLGDFHEGSGEPLPPAMRASLVHWLATCCTMWALPPLTSIRGHNEIDGQNTSCPGSFIDMDQIREDVRLVLTVQFGGPRENRNT